MAEAEGGRADAAGGVLKYNPTLTALSLTNAGIDAEGAEALATALEANRAPQSVDFSGNQLLRVAGSSTPASTSRGCVR